MRLRDLFAKSDKNKAMTVVAMVMLALTTAFFYEGLTLHSNTIEKVIQERKQAIDSVVTDITLFSLAPYQQRLANLVTTHPEISQALHAQDRDTLHRLTQPLYAALQRENAYLHVMHYHLPDGRSFLRMHTPGTFGDDLNEIRPAINFVHQQKTPLNCYEIGIYGAFYRIIQPVFHQDTYVGALELGIRVHTIMESIQKQIPDPITTFFLAKHWQRVIDEPGHESLDFGEYTVITHNIPLYHHLPRDLDLSLPNQRLRLAGKDYLVHSHPVFTDFRGEKMGGFIVLQDISQPLAAKKTFIFRSIAFSGSLFALAMVVLYLGFGRLIGKLEDSQATLKKTVAKLVVEVEERKQTENNLLRSKNEWERTFNAIGDIVTILDSKLRIIKANKTAHEALGVQPGSLIGKFCHEVFSNRSTACDHCPAVHTLENRLVHVAEIEHQNLGKEFLITTSPVPDETGEFSHIVHIAKDITEKKALEAKLRQAQKMEAIGTLAGGIAHDFNNILTAISGYTQLAVIKAGDNKKVTRDLEQVTNAARRAKDLVRQILTFSRQAEQKQQPIHLSPIVTETLKLLRSSMPSSIALRKNITTPGPILADPSQIHQIIMNLATNAYHAMQETGGILGISVQEVILNDTELPVDIKIKQGTYIRLEVSDTGYGMDEETKAKIFEPYFTTKEVGKGTGLGLAVVHGIVSAHHGHINVYSEPGQGTTFHVYLPRVDEEPANDTPPAVPEPVRGGTERLILIDDEEIIVHLAAEVLKDLGYTVASFSDSKLAWDTFAARPDDYDLVITDMSMPHLSGLQLTEKIRKIRPATPVILCSGYGETVMKDKALAMGVSRYLQKPLDMDILARILRELLDEA
jgi:PAS domain S-box-containing protein